MQIGEIQALAIKQLEHLFGLSNEEKEQITLECVTEAHQRAIACFMGVRNKYYTQDGVVHFNPFHSGQYTKFLYLLSARLSEQGFSGAADKVYYLNKSLNSVDIYHQVKLPQVFFFEHPVATVLGKADYGNYFACYQQCTVGGNLELAYPKFGKNNVMFGGSTVIGESMVGDNVYFSFGCYVKDAVIPSNCIVFGRSPDLTFIEKNVKYFIENSPFFMNGKE